MGMDLTCTPRRRRDEYWRGGALYPDAFRRLWQRLAARRDEGPTEKVLADPRRIRVCVADIIIMAYEADGVALHQSALAASHTYRSVHTSSHMHDGLRWPASPSHLSFFFCLPHTMPFLKAPPGTPPGEAAKPLHLTLGRDRLRSIKRGHPWVFQEVSVCVQGGGMVFAGYPIQAGGGSLED